MMKKQTQVLDIKDVDLNALGKANKLEEVVLSPVIGQFMAFNVGKECYALEINQVQEIVGWTGVTALPNTHDYMLGVLNLRGVVVPVFDLKCRFGGGTTEATPTHVIIIVKVGNRVMGILVDVVSDIITVRQDQVKSISKSSKRGDKDFLLHHFMVEKRKISQISIDTLFDLDNVFVNKKLNKNNKLKKKK